MAQTAKQYEAMFLVGQQTAAEPQKAIDLCRGVIERHGGEILVIKRWDERRLAYEIEGHKRGTYILAYFRGPGSAVAGIERDVNLSEEILRVMVVRADHLNREEMEAAEPQPVTAREERSPAGAGAGRPRREEHAPVEEEAAKD